MDKFRLSSFCCAVWLAALLLGPAPSAFAAPTYADQGPQWNPTERQNFYCQGQGSKLIRLKWLQALEVSIGKHFLQNNLSEFGYLADDSCGTGLPVGFTTSKVAGEQWAGMTCAACHTREIRGPGGSAETLRIDGGPAINDFYAFTQGLDSAVLSTLNDSASFQRFATAVLGHPPKKSETQKLRVALKSWSDRSKAIMSKQTSPWGLGRLDAIGMILNRVTGLDLGKIIHGNIKAADAPARYPFLWNAPKQDYTQWLGFAENGSDLRALGRNLGQVLGVFGEFRYEGFLQYRSSGDFPGLDRLEQAVKKIGRPRWPWSLNATLVAQGKTVFESSSARCSECHAQQPGERKNTWRTDLRDVGTDRRAGRYLSQNVDTGNMKGAWLPFISCGFNALKKTDRAMNVLNLAVAGSIYQDLVGGEQNFITQQATSEGVAGLQYRNTTASCGGTPDIVFEGRVLYGIWAAAPYLHNGSVPTLADLLEPASKRPLAFDMGADYDINRVGIAVTQKGKSDRFILTGCEARDSGNSNCGHEYGVELSSDEKNALLEYLKWL